MSSNAHLVDDVLQQIFLWSIIDSNKYRDIGRFDFLGSSLRELPQLSISHVCSTWRQVALLTPRLWNRVCIKDIFHFRMHMAKEWLSRALNTPVSVSVNVSCDNDDVYYSTLHLFLSSYRIQHLDIYSSRPFPSLNLSARNVADLETLTMDVGLFCQTRRNINLNVSQYPKLSRLSVQGNCQCILSGTCGALQKLEIKESLLTVYEFWDILTSCSVLEEFTVSLGHDISGRLPSAKNLYLPHLRILWFNHWDKNTGIPFAAMIDPLTLPHLETFYVSKCPVDWSTPAFGALVKRSNGLPHLTFFCLDKPNVVVDAGDIISLIPSVTKLLLCILLSSLWSVIFDRDTLNGLAHGSLGPRLKEIIVGGIPNPHDFMDMVESRMENARKRKDGTLTRFTRVWVGYEYNESVSFHLRKLQKRGIPIWSYWCPEVV